MSLSRESVCSLIDLIENKLSHMTVADRDDLRQRVCLQRALTELATMAGVNRELEDTGFYVPRRGRRRRFTGTESFA